jgi:FlaA1/EpsC-like NDP-sugar epimerase
MSTQSNNATTPSMKTLGVAQQAAKAREKLLALPRAPKRALMVLHDGILCGVACLAAFAFTGGSDFGSLDLALSLGSSALLAVGTFAVMGLYNAIFRYSGLHSLTLLGRACVVYGAVFATAVWGLGGDSMPAGFGVLQPLLYCLAVATSRLAARMWLDDLFASARQDEGKTRALIFGAGSAGRQLAAAMFRSADHKVVGYLDDDERLWGHTLDGLRVFSPHALDQCITSTRAQEVLLAIPSARHARRNSIIQSLRPWPLHVRTLPGLADLASGRVGLGDLRELDIEDLLGRDPVVANALLMNRHIRGKVVLVTGAGGSIGSELCRQIMGCAPAQLLLLENSEFALYQIHQELEGRGIEVLPLLCSVTDAPRLNEVFATWCPHTVYHAAAYKHVPLVEHNAAQGVRNNVWGTWECARAAMAHGVSHFVLVSTDKAVRPTNIMGASKRLAELVLQGLAGTGAHGNGRTCFAMVRFGNVLGSSGSVVPLFREQIRNGGPITLTHPDITRYFMTIPEAAQLVIQAGAMATGDDVFVLDMGQPVRIMDLARRLVELSGFTVRDAANPQGDIEIVSTGLRPGEKLYEELLIGDNPQDTQHPRIKREHEESVPWQALESALAELGALLVANDVPAIKVHMERLVNGYQPATEVVDWVWCQQASQRTPMGGSFVGRT